MSKIKNNNNGGENEFRERGGSLERPRLCLDTLAERTTHPNNSSGLLFFFLFNVCFYAKI